jgi:putative ABC transport system permease protein
LSQDRRRRWYEHGLRSECLIPLSYNIRNLRVRWKTTLMTISGFALVTAALVVMLACLNGVEAVCATSGQPHNVIVLSFGSTDEVLSRINADDASQIEAMRGIGRDSDGRLLSSREVFLVIQSSLAAEQEGAFLQVRGVTPSALLVHPQVRVVEGRMFQTGNSEMIIGCGVMRSRGLKVGDQLTLGRKTWTISGVFRADGALESEVWGDLNEVTSHFRRTGSYTSLVLRTHDESAANALIRSLRSNRSLRTQSLTEREYYARQAAPLAVIRGTTWGMALVMALGAVFGIMNTMYAAIGERIKDIAVMRVIGFSQVQILCAFLLETMLITAAGIGVGLLVGSATNGLTLSSAIGTTGLEVEFAFRVDAQVVVQSAAVVLAMGIAGGLIPALSAVRIRAVEALVA